MDLRGKALSLSHMSTPYILQRIRMHSINLIRGLFAAVLSLSLHLIGFLSMTLEYVTYIWYRVTNFIDPNTYTNKLTASTSRHRIYYKQTL